MNVELAEERALILPDQLTAEQAETKAVAKRLDAFGTLAKVSGFLSRPKDEAFELVYKERRLQPFWRLTASAVTVYERRRDYVVKVAPEVTRVAVAGSELATPDGAFTLSGLESCRDEHRQEVFYDALTKAEEPKLAEALKVTGVMTSAEELGRLAQAGTIVVPPEVKASLLVREMIAGLVHKIEADRVLEETVRLEAVDLYYRPVYAFRYRRQGKEAVVEVDALSGAAHAGGSTFEKHLGKMLDPAFLLDVTVETANIFLPGATLVKVLVNKGLEMRKR